MGAVFMLLGGPVGMIVGFGMLLGGSIIQYEVAKRQMEEALNSNKAQVNGLQANFRSSQSPIQLFYGRQKVGFNYLYVKSFGANKERLIIVGGVGEGEIDAVEEVYFGDKTVWRNGVLIDGPFKPTVEFDWRPGTNTQTCFSQVTALDPDFTDCYRNTAVFYLSITYDQNVYQSVPLITFLVRGRKVFDPRDGLTKWVQNGPLEWRDAATNTRYGGRVPTSRVDDVAIAEEANFCDTTEARGAELAVTGEQIGIGNGAFRGHSITGMRDGGGTYGGWLLPPVSPNEVYVEVFSFNFGIASGRDSGYGNVIIYQDGNPGDVQRAHATVNYDTGYVETTIDHPDPNHNGGGAMYISGQRTFQTTLQYAPVKPGSVSFAAICLRVRPSGAPYTHLAERWGQPVEFTETFTDNGTGVLGGSAGGTGTIDYTTGAISITFATAPKQGEPIRIDYINSSTGSLRRFVTNFFAVNGSPALDVLRELCGHFLGMMVYSGGKIKLRVAKPETPAMDFRSGGEESSLSNNIVNGTFAWKSVGIREIPHSVRAKWVDPLEGYRVKDYTAPISSALGGKGELTLELLGVTSMNVLEPLVLTQRNLAQKEIFCSFNSFLAALALEPCDTVRITHPAAGWTNKLFRVLTVKYLIRTEQVALELVEYSASDYVYAPEATAISAPSPGASLTPDLAPPAVDNFALAEFQRVLKDGTRATFIRATWDLPADYPYLEAVEIYIGNWLDAQAVAYVGETSGTYFEYGPVRDGEYYAAWAIIRSANGVRWESVGRWATITIVGKTSAPTAPTFDDTASKFTDQCYLYWNPIADNDLGNYELRTDTNWGNATNRLYLGKGTHFIYNPLDYGGGASQTFYLKSVDTSGNYSAAYDTLALTNGAPTTPATATDFTGRECYVRWDACPDVDFKEWELRIYSDAGRTTLKRTVILQQNHYVYRYEDIKADFGGAGDPQNLYFRLTVRDRYDSTVQVDFAASQATPAIIQYDGGGVERVRIGALGSGAYGARFKDSAGNITFEQGDTLKQQFMKLDKIQSLRISVPLRAPFAADTVAWGQGFYDGEVAIVHPAANNNIYVGLVSDSVDEKKALTNFWANTGTVLGFCGSRIDANGIQAIIAVSGVGLRHLRISYPAWTLAAGPTTITANAVTGPRLGARYSTEQWVVYKNNNNNLAMLSYTMSNGTLVKGPVEFTGAPLGNGEIIAAYGDYDNGSARAYTHVLYRWHGNSGGLNTSIVRHIVIDGNSPYNVISGPTDVGYSVVESSSDIMSGAVIQGNDTLADDLFYFFKPGQTVGDLWICAGTASSLLGPYKLRYKTYPGWIYLGSGALFYGTTAPQYSNRIPFMCVNGWDFPKTLCLANFMYSEMANKNLQDSLISMNV